MLAGIGAGHDLHWCHLNVNLQFCISVLLRLVLAFSGGHLANRAVQQCVSKVHFFSVCASEVRVRIIASTRLLVFALATNENPNEIALEGSRIGPVAPQRRDSAIDTVKRN